MLSKENEIDKQILLFLNLLFFNLRVYKFITENTINFVERINHNFLFYINLDVKFEKL